MISRSYFAALFLLVSVSTWFNPNMAYAQDLWNTLRPAKLDSGTYFYYSVSACDDHNFIASGWFQPDRKLSKPVIVRSTDAGKTWMVQDPGIVANSQLGRQIRKILLRDSLHAIAIGDSGTIVRTSNGGSTWFRQDFGTTANLTDISFSDEKNGVIVGGLGTILLTSDTGVTWRPVPTFPSRFLVNCRAYGNGKYRVYAYGDGPIYTTRDSFQSWDSTRIFDYTDSLHGIKNINGCAFLGSDSVIAYGWWQVDTSKPNAFWSYLLVSPDAGRNWHEQIAEYTHVAFELTTVASSSLGVWLAGGRGAGILYTKDFGGHWIDDSLFVTGPQRNLYYQLSSLQVVSTSRVVGIAGEPFESAIVDLTLSNLSVQSFEHIVYSTRVYPNPATDYVNIQSDIRSQPIYLMDVLGREVIRDVLDGNGSLRLDLTHLSGGVYQVAMDYNGKRIHITNLVVLR